MTKKHAKLPSMQRVKKKCLSGYHYKCYVFFLFFFVIYFFIYFAIKRISYSKYPPAHYVCAVYTVFMLSAHLIVHPSVIYVFVSAWGYLISTAY